MAPSTRERSRKSSPEHNKSSVAPTTPAVEQPAPVVTTGVGTISTLSEGISQPFDSEEVCTDISYDEDSPSSDESDLIVGKHKKRKHSKRGLRAKDNRNKQLIKTLLTLLEKNEAESESGFESESESKSESEDQNRKKTFSSKSKYLKELTHEEIRIMKSIQRLKNMKYPEFTYSSDVNEIYDYIEEFRDYCKVIYTTKGFYLVEQILCSLKGLSQEWFRAEVIGADDYVENEFNLGMFCKLFKQRFLPPDHLIILFKQTTMNFKFNFSNPRKSFDPILISMNRLKGQITEEQFFVLLCYCLHTPTGIQERMDVKADLQNMHTFIDAYVKHISHCGDGKTGLDTLDYVNIPSILNTRNNYRAAKGFRPKRDKQAKPTGQFPLNKKAKRNNQNKGKCSVCHKRGHTAEKCWSKN